MAHGDKAVVLDHGDHKHLLLLGPNHPPTSAAFLAVFVLMIAAQVRLPFSVMCVCVCVCDDYFYQLSSICGVDLVGLFEFERSSFFLSFFLSCFFACFHLFSLSHFVSWLLFVLRVLFSQVGIFAWKQHYHRSFMNVTLVGLWVIPFLMSVSARFYRFLFVWFVVAVTFASFVSFLLFFPQRVYRREGGERVVFHGRSKHSVRIRLRGAAREDENIFMTKTGLQHPCALCWS
jgi:hypothetical protein